MSAFCWFASVLTATHPFRFGLRLVFHRQICIDRDPRPPVGEMDIKQLRDELARLKDEIVCLGNQAAALEEQVRLIRNELVGYTSGMARLENLRTRRSAISGTVDGGRDNIMPVDDNGDCGVSFNTESVSAARMFGNLDESEAEP